MSERFFYAELNEENVCIGLIETDVAPEEISEGFVQVDSMDESLLFSIYNPDTGEWEKAEPPTPEPAETQLDRIEQEVKKSNDVLRQEGQAEMAQRAAFAMKLCAEPPVYAGLFKDAYPEWIADGEKEETGHISVYNGTVYQCNVSAQRIQEYAPDKATNNYNPYPEPDIDGIYPYVYGMGVIKDMLVRDNDKVYRCILETDKPYKLIYAPADVPAVFVEV